MSTDDRTPSSPDEGRTVATDADQSGVPAADPAPVADGAPPAAPSPDVQPSPVPRTEPVVEEPAAVDPAGASPPPWRRVPDPNEQQLEAEQPTVADSLLSEAPTAFLTAPAAGGAATAVREPEQRETGAETPRASVRNRPPRQALLQLKRFDPWSVLKMALALAIVLWLVWMVAAGVLYGVLGGMGVWDRLNGTYADLVTGQEETGGALISAGRVFGLAAVVGAVNSLLFAVAITIVAFVYNVAADLVGGVEVTLSERD
ncbi:MULTISPECIES: DUF3566 domain-containing protein [Pseudonocardia]|uniref:DUF3566 domain-containing protein n=2 Tax=Pseudonocardia TaxID=1847 RepID=A0A1Y2MVJ4_PSEAH|nr:MULTISPECIES: DUF3566 domain-containing protein [Pseudonocardia]OSY38658.1 hypothetical protein BG845_03858 [Pseudonocardia autotrophica]TDN74861.1 transmembrane protein DUF3566 [Pseudonocardia autotrophica]BBF98799.1 hypothetical protein Pdca_00090 [Pseudonocardia autotrophica]GEC26517.1 hypothetical protein PSA01_35460 [Pseudonocardia saturnea]